MVANEREGEGEGEQSFVNNTLELDDIPQIPLPFTDELSNDLKNLLRALVINQQNLIENCNFLFTKIQELTTVMGRMQQQLEPNTDPRLEPALE